MTDDSRKPPFNLNCTGTHLILFRGGAEMEWSAPGGRAVPFTSPLIFQVTGVRVGEEKVQEFMHNMESVLREGNSHARTS